MSAHIARAITVSLATAALVGTVAAAVPVAAVPGSDKRPCVSTTEYQQTRDVMHYRSADVTGPNRRTLERRWEVRGLGMVDEEFSDDESTMWLYSVCGYAFEDAQVWTVNDAEVPNRNGVVLIISLWIRPGAAPSGNVY